MNNSFFLKNSYVSVIPHTIIAYLLVISFIVFKIAKGKELSVESVFSIVFFTVVLILIIKYDNSTGLYIKGIDIYYKNLKSNKISIHDIVGVKIIQAYSVGKYQTFYPIKNKRGEVIYSAFFLKSLTEEMFSYKKGDLWFNKDFKNHIICSTVYEQNAINYLKDTNPGIKVIQ